MSRFAFKWGYGHIPHTLECKSNYSFYANHFTYCVFVTQILCPNVLTGKFIRLHIFDHLLLLIISLGTHRVISSNLMLPHTGNALLCILTVCDLCLRPHRGYPAVNSQTTFLEFAKNTATSICNNLLGNYTDYLKAAGHMQVTHTYTHVSHVCCIFL